MSRELTAIQWEHPQRTEPAPRPARRNRKPGEKFKAHAPDEATVPAARATENILRWLGAFCTDDAKSVTATTDGSVTIATWNAMFAVDRGGRVEFAINQQALEESCGKR